MNESNIGFVFRFQRFFAKRRHIFRITLLMTRFFQRHRKLLQKSHKGLNFAVGFIFTFALQIIHFGFSLLKSITYCRKENIN